jgi:L-fuconolactonase
MMIVDAHHHFWRLDRGYAWLDDPAFAPIRRDFGVAELRAALAGTGVRRTVLVEAARCRAAEVTEFLTVAAATEEIAGVVGWVDLTDSDLAGTLAAYRGRRGGSRLVGVRAQVQGEPDPAYLSRPDVHHGLSTVADAGLVYDLVVRVDQLPAAVVAARAVPGLTFVLDHLGKPEIRHGAAGLRRWRDAVAPLAAEPNVVAKLSGLVTEADWTQWTVDDLRPYVSEALELFGPRRLMFGSDWPVCLLAAPYRAVLDALDDALDTALGAGPGAADRAEIYAGTAVRTYRLDSREDELA